MKKIISGKLAGKGIIVFLGVLFLFLMSSPVFSASKSIATLTQF